MEPAAAASTSAPSAPVSSGTQFLRAHMLKLAPYTPIEPFEILSARYGRTTDQIIKLDANENPYGPPPEVREALGKMAFPHIYPDPESRTLRAALSKMNDIPAEHLLVSKRALPGAYVFICMLWGRVGLGRHHAWWGGCQVALCKPGDVGQWQVGQVGC